MIYKVFDTVTAVFRGVGEFLFRCKPVTEIDDLDTGFIAVPAAFRIKSDFNGQLSEKSVICNEIFKKVSYLVLFMKYFYT